MMLRVPDHPAVVVPAVIGDRMFCPLLTQSDAAMCIPLTHLNSLRAFHPEMGVYVSPAGPLAPRESSSV